MFAAVQQLYFTPCSCNGWADSLSNPVRAFLKTRGPELLRDLGSTIQRIYCIQVILACRKFSARGNLMCYSSFWYFSSGPVFALSTDLESPNYTLPFNLTTLSHWGYQTNNSALLACVKFSSLRWSHDSVAYWNRQVKIISYQWNWFIQYFATQNTTTVSTADPPSPQYKNPHLPFSYSVVNQLLISNRKQVC